MTPEHPTQPEDVRKLVEELREPEFAGAMQHLRSWSDIDRLMNEAANTIEALTASVAPGVTRDEIARVICGRAKHWSGLFDTWRVHPNAAIELADEILALLSGPTLRINPMSDALEVLRAKVEAATDDALQSCACAGDPAGGQCPAERRCGVWTIAQLAKRLCTDEGVEAMARAIADAVGGSNQAWIWDASSEDRREQFRRDARAAIRAIIGEQP